MLKGYSLAVLIFVIANNLNAAIIVLMPDGTTGKDARIADRHPNSNYGTDGYLSVNYGDGVRHISLLEFDLTAIPAGSKINSAVLSVFHAASTGLNHTYQLFRVTSSWNEESITFNTAPTFNPSPAASLTILDKIVEVYREWNITSLADGWISGQFPNYGMTIERESVLEGVVWFHSSDIGWTDQRPKLTIDYSVPEPSTIALGLLSLPALFALRRRLC